MKAWKVSTKYGDYATVVFAETRGKAKSIALYTDACCDANFCDIVVCRMKAMDKYYKDGKTEMDWENPDDRFILVKEFGWYCVDSVIPLCEKCSAKDYCCGYQDFLKHMADIQKEASR